MHLLVPYVHLRPPDPLFTEFTYGDHGNRGRKLKTDVNKGDYIFFHTSIGGKKFITAYYVIDRVLDVMEACQDKAIRLKYKNHHLIDYLEGRKLAKDDVIVFGDPITSYIFEKPLLFDRKLIDTLSLNIKFSANLTEARAVVSATRAWRQLTDEDVKILLNAIESAQSQPRQKLLRSTEEVAETIEKDVEDYLADNPNLIGTDLKLSKRQVPIKTGRIDLLFEDEQGNLIVVEVKLHKVGRDALQQIQRYMHESRKESGKKVRGVLVCAGVMPAYEDDLRKQKDVQILIYGWDLKVQNW
jgi:hypothetical protein